MFKWKQMLSRIGKLVFFLSSDASMSPLSHISNESHTLKPNHIESTINTHMQMHTNSTQMPHTKRLQMGVMCHKVRQDRNSDLWSEWLAHIYNLRHTNFPMMLHICQSPSKMFFRISKAKILNSAKNKNSFYNTEMTVLTEVCKENK